MFNMFEELFAPGRKHTNDERKRLELSRVDLNDGDPGRGPIDLSSGKVVVRPPGPGGTTPPSPAAEAETQTEAEPQTETEAEPQTETEAQPQADTKAEKPDGD
ncbi:MULTISPECIES: DUF6191 domain-containing protein [unclassified Streptomyces]|uniref:DUF6191 domain-containing protein n=1 Tax=unclassified Streptomyces TaxID=2593676 RepID=UPI00386F4427|nr:DUF6191 domain-containing protein [Streptomyces sp. NBC_00827]